MVSAKLRVFNIDLNRPIPDLESVGIVENYCERSLERQTCRMCASVSYCGLCVQFACSVV